ncbi:MAG: hypothetical protein Greene041619_893 [Candidatus Peregrinibacteria bacterium Greene0416_19]|nr:MAG: hypothetical protein Greene041619_893 [Candidatus Peregrinibacteria bacterium Greene0416_19]
MPPARHHHSLMVLAAAVAGMVAGTVAVSVLRGVMLTAQILSDSQAGATVMQDQLQIISIPEDGTLFPSDWSIGSAASSDAGAAAPDPILPVGAQTDAPLPSIEQFLSSAVGGDPFIVDPASVDSSAESFTLPTDRGSMQVKRPVQAAIPVQSRPPGPVDPVTVPPTPSSTVGVAPTCIGHDGITIARPADPFRQCSVELTRALFLQETGGHVIATDGSSVILEQQSTDDQVIERARGAVADVLRGVGLLLSRTDSADVRTQLNAVIVTISAFLEQRYPTKEEIAEAVGRIRLQLQQAAAPSHAAAPAVTTASLQAVSRLVRSLTAAVNAGIRAQVDGKVTVFDADKARSALVRVQDLWGTAQGECVDSNAERCQTAQRDVFAAMRALRAALATAEDNAAVMTVMQQAFRQEAGAESEGGVSVEAPVAPSPPHRVPVYDFPSAARPNTPLQ